jgi:hypothetical protein
VRHTDSLANTDRADLVQQYSYPRFSAFG